MKRRDGIGPKRPCLLRSTVRTAPRHDSLHISGWEYSDLAEPVATSETSESSSDCDAVIRPSKHELPYRGLDRRFELRAWEVVQEDIDDFNNSYSLRTLPRFHSFGTFGNYGYSLSLTKTSQIPPGTSEVPDLLLRKLAIQLLSTCFTLNPWTPSRNSDPCGDLNRPDDYPTHISALRILSRHCSSPAFGHNARENSVASPWPALHFEPSRESKLAEEVTKRRLLRIQLEEDTLSSQSGHRHLAGLRRASSSNEELPNQEVIRHRRLSSIEELPLRKAPFRRARLDRLLWPQSGIPVTSRTTRLSSSDDGRPVTSLHPFLRSEPHPVFIQPVKELVVRRSKLKSIRSRARKIVIRQRPDEQRAPNEMRCSGHSRRQLAMDSGSAHVGGRMEALSISALVSPLWGSTISLLRSTTLASHPRNDHSLPSISGDDNQSAEQLLRTTPHPYLETTSEENPHVPVCSRVIHFEESETSLLSNPEANNSLVNQSPFPSPTASPQDVAFYQFEATNMARRGRTSTAGTTVFTPRAIAETRANTEGILTAGVDELSPSDDDWSTAPVSPVESRIQLARQPYQTYSGGRSSFL